jgi:hypothetical protein
MSYNDELKQGIEQQFMKDVLDGETAVFTAIYALQSLVSEADVPSYHVTQDMQDLSQALGLLNAVLARNEK